MNFEESLVRLLIDAHAAGIEVRYTDGRVQAVPHGEITDTQRAVGVRLRQDKLALLGHLANWDEYTTQRIVAEIHALRRLSPDIWTRDPSDGIGVAQDRVEDAARSGDAAWFEHALYQYRLVTLRAFRASIRARGKPLTEDDLVDVVLKIAQPGQPITRRPIRTREPHDPPLPPFVPKPVAEETPPPVVDVVLGPTDLRIVRHPSALPSQDAREAHPSQDARGSSRPQVATPSRGFPRRRG